MLFRSAINASLSQPSVLGMRNGELFFADVLNNRLRKIENNSIISTIAGNGFRGYYSDGGLATNATLLNPEGACFDRTGNLIIAGGNDNCVLKIDHQSGMISRIAGNGLLLPNLINSIQDFNDTATTEIYTT